MSKSLDQLDQAVKSVIKDSTGKAMTKDQLIEIIDDTIGFLNNANNFFVNLGDCGNKLKQYVDQNVNRSELQSMAIYKQINTSLCTAAKKAMESAFLGAFVDTGKALTIILNQCNDNINQLFADKTITVYNTKISQVAILGMVQNARMFSQYVVDYIALFMSDRSENMFKPARYTLESLKTHTAEVIELINRTLGAKLSNSFVQAIKKYRSSGADVGLVNGASQSTVQFAKINTDVTDVDIKAGARGLAIFKWIGDFFTNISDTKRRKLIAERDMLDARAQLLQLDLNGVDPDSPEYKKLSTIIKNYQALIDRLNAKIAKYEAD